MILEDRIKAFLSLGKFLKQFCDKTADKDENVLHNELFFHRFETLMEQSVHYNGWFTKEQVVFAVKNWAEALTEDALREWTSPYDFSEEPLKTVGLILAGNIPLVGFHDVLSVLISGNRALIKTSSDDDKLIPLLLEYLIAIEPRFAGRMVITKDKLTDFDAVIATGSNNTSRYFEYYFRNVPNIIRKNRNSVAVLTGDESVEDLKNLGKDIFRYYGLGCRNVSKLFVPKGYDFKNFFEAMYDFQDIIHYEKYANNYDYNKAVYLMSNYQILDNGFLTIRESEGYSSPISSVFYEFYDDLDVLKQKLENDQEQLQCVVSEANVTNNIPFGSTQSPDLWDYADGVDTLKFLLHLHK